MDVLYRAIDRKVSKTHLLLWWETGPVQEKGHTPQKLSQRQSVLSARRMAGTPITETRWKDACDAQRAAEKTVLWNCLGAEHRRRLVFTVFTLR